MCVGGWRASQKVHSRKPASSEFTTSPLFISQWIFSLFPWRPHYIQYFITKLFLIPPKEETTVGRKSRRLSEVIQPVSDGADPSPQNPLGSTSPLTEPPLHTQQYSCVALEGGTQPSSLCGLWEAEGQPLVPWEHPAPNSRLLCSSSPLPRSP